MPRSPRRSRSWRASRPSEHSPPRRVHCALLARATTISRASSALPLPRRLSAAASSASTTVACGWASAQAPCSPPSASTGDRSWSSGGRSFAPASTGRNAGRILPARLAQHSSRPSRKNAGCSPSRALASSPSRRRAGRRSSTCSISVRLSTATNKRGRSPNSSGPDREYRTWTAYNNEFGLRPRTDPRDPRAGEALRLRAAGAEADRPRDPPRRDLRAARAERRRQDDAHQHRLRHRHAERGHRNRGRTRHPARLPRRARDDWPRAAGARHHALRERGADGELQPRPLRQAGESRLCREGAQGCIAVGAQKEQDRHALGRHETPRDDRQGAGARAAGPVPRRADGRCRCRAAPGHVGGGTQAARVRRDHHPHHPLHRGGGADRRSHRRHQQGRHRPRRGEARAHAQARPQAAHAAAARGARRRPGAPGALPSHARRRGSRAHLYLRHASAAHRDYPSAGRPRGRGYRLQGPADDAKLARGHLRRPGEGRAMNWRAIAAIYTFEMARTGRTLVQSIVAPVITTALYFVVFGAAMGTRISQVDGVAYGAFIVPGLIMLTLLTQSVTNAAFGIYFPKFVGTIYELLSAPISALELVIGYVGAAATKSVILGLVILATAFFFVPLRIEHPLWMVAFLILTAVTFSLLGFIIGVWAGGFEQLQFVPMLVITPLTFLGGTFYSISVLPPAWQTVTLFNPVVYLISGFRWSFFEIADVHVGISLGMTAVFLGACLAMVWWIFKTGYRLKT